MEDGLVSIMIPCYQSAATLARALSSLRAQTVANWEAIVIDDGSSDDPEKVIRAFNDPRVRFHRFDINRGRASARQKALELARGNFLAMLDADDWWLPQKLERQLEVLQEDPALALVSTPMFLERASGALAGVSRHGSGPRIEKHEPLGAPRALPVAHAPILARRSALAGRSYDQSLRSSEDLDFFLPVLLKHPYAVLNEPLYVYSFEGNRSLPRIEAQLQAHRRVFAKHLARHPIAAGRRLLSTYPKAALYRSLFALGLGERVSARAFLAPSPAQAEEFGRAKATLEAEAARTFAPIGA